MLEFELNELILLNFMRGYVEAVLDNSWETKEVAIVEAIERAKKVYSQHKNEDCFSSAIAQLRNSQDLPF